MRTWQTPLFRELDTGLDHLVGSKTATALAKMGLRTIHDLLRHVPLHLMSGTDVSDIAQIVADRKAGRGSDYVALIADVRSVQRKGQPPRSRLEVTLTDGTGTLGVTFFGRPHLIDYWERSLSTSERGIFAGKLGWFNNAPQLAHPAFVMLTDRGLVGTADSTRMAEQVRKSNFVGLYPQSAAVPTWTIAECEELALDRIAGLSDPMPQWVRDQVELLDFETACRAVHAPTNIEDFAAGKRRLIFDEAFATQVAMAYRRASSSRLKATPRPRQSDGLLDAFDAQLPYTLTDEQVTVSQEIFAELAKPAPMQRLLQGEVGSGKTVVALRAMLNVIDTGGQTVLLAPTEVLAQQHFGSVQALMGDLASGGLLGGDLGTEVVLLTGSTPAAARREVMAKIADGTAGIVIGTHALLDNRVEFADLGLVVVDEQHRFGVEQRNELGARGRTHPHVLVMTATPIPRSVAMTVFGDLDVSTLTQVPAGRQPVSTTVVDQVARPAWVERAWQRINEEVAAGRQAFVIAPRIASDDTGAGVEEVYQQLSEGPLADVRVGMLHGRLPSAAKTEVMNQFATGNLDVLVATTVVEVGVDVPNATVMVILDADRFGISQLHQLRGRIGRGGHPGVCLLITGAEVGTLARERLDVVAATSDGFVLAEADLQQRREGDVLGTSQAGARSSLRLLRVLDHAEDIQAARSIAEKIVADDPDQSDPGVHDYVTEIEQLAQTDWAEST